MSDLLYETLVEKGANVNDGKVVLYHYTNKTNAQNIIKTKKMTAKEDSVFFTTKLGGQATGYGDNIICINAPISRLIIDDEFDDEVHVRIPLGRNRELNIADMMK